MKNMILLTTFILVSALILIASLRGLPGNPNAHQLNSPRWQGQGPLELSPERGRYALTYSLVEDKSFEFSLPLARFATPDLGYHNGKFVSLFAPGVSYLVIPGYVLGKQFGLAQVGTYLVISLFALINAIMIYLFSKSLKLPTEAGILAGLTFLFATPAYAYAVSLFQHHVSTFILLLCVLLLLRYPKKWWSLSLIWALCASSIPLDYPNAFFLFPIGMYALLQFFTVEVVKKKLAIKIHILLPLTMLAMSGPLLFFFWFNLQSYNNPLQLSGTIVAVKELDANGQPVGDHLVSTVNQSETPNKVDPAEKSAIGFFRSRNLLNGFNTHFISPDRGILYFTPVLLLSIWGGFQLYKTHPQVTALLLAIAGANVLLYSMWGDPYGGWAFGSRYLVPTYAVSAMLLSAALADRKRKWIILPIFLVLFIYSVRVNTMGALTSNLNPPKIEIQALQDQSKKIEQYTYQRNLDLLLNNESKSFVFLQYFQDNFTALQYFRIIMTIIIFTGFIPTIFLLVPNRMNIRK